MKFTLDYTNMLARQFGYKGNLHEFWLGMNFESEHDNVKLRTDTKSNNTKSNNTKSNDNKSNNTFLTTKNPRTSIAFNITSLTARATIANLEEKPHYYSQLLKIEEK